MAYDEELATRIRVLLSELAADAGPMEEKRMFGGLAFMVGGHMAVGLTGKGGVMARVGAEEAPALRQRAHVGPMTMASRESRTWVHVEPPAVETDDQLREWVARGLAIVAELD